jgi:signal peptidase I
MVGGARRKRNWLRSLVTIFGIAIVGSTLLKIFVFQTFYVPSGSMEQTLMISDRFLVSRLSGEISRGDIVVFYDYAGWMAETEQEQAIRKGTVTRFLKMNGVIPSRNNDIMVKRVIGVPGDHLVCCNANAQLELNGMPLEEPYLVAGSHASRMPFEVKVPQDSLFVLGDNRDKSADSRYFLEHPSGGFVSTNDVIGRAVATVWPITSMTLHNTSIGTTLEAVQGD